MKKRVVVMGGGTGTYTVLTAIKNISGIKITAVVSSTDSGGSTGVLRDEFGVLPVGDFRQCLVALAQDDGNDNLIRELFKYRFSKGGSGLEGHNFGNLFLTALTDILQTEERAIMKASKILNIKGRVYPVTYDNIQLMAQYGDGSIAFGEAMIDSPPKNHDGRQKIVKLWTQPKGAVSKRAKEAVVSADYIIMGPGDLYSSILATVVVGQMNKYIKKSKGKLIYITNLVSKYGQTHNMKLSEYITEIEKYSCKRVDKILVNNKKPSEYIIKKYKAEKAYFVEDDLVGDKRVTKKDLLSGSLHKQTQSDRVRRSLLRHDVNKIKKALEKLFHNLK